MLKHTKQKSKRQSEHQQIYYVIFPSGKSCSFVNENFNIICYDSIVIVILQINSLRWNEMEKLEHIHIAKKWQSLDSLLPQCCTTVQCTVSSTLKYFCDLFILHVNHTFCSLLEVDSFVFQPAQKVHIMKTNGKSVFWKTLCV